MQTATDFKGGVFSEAIDGGRAGAEIELQVAGIRARTSEGQEFVLPFRECRVEIGGASGRMVFCRNEDRSLTIFCDERGFLQALEFHSSGMLDQQLADLAQTRSGQRRRRLAWFAFAAVLLVGLLVGGYYGLMAGARAAATALPISIDEKIGAMAIESMDVQGPYVDDPVVVGAIRTMVQRLAPHAGGFEFKVRVVDAPIVNAFALPGGHIVVYTGLIKEAQRPEQVAAVLAHEMAHVTCRHGMQRVAQAMGISIAVGLVFGDASGFVALAANLLQTSALSSYSRDHETEADTEGVRLLHAAGIDPLELASFFKVMEEKHGDVPDAISWLSTHPQHADRIDSIKQLAASLPAKEYSVLQIDWDRVTGQVQQLEGKPPKQIEAKQ